MPGECPGLYNMSSRIVLSIPLDCNLAGGWACPRIEGCFGGTIGKDRRAGALHAELLRLFGYLICMRAVRRTGE